MIKKDGRMSLKENFFSHTGIATLEEWLLVLLGNMNFHVLNKIQDKNERILILDVQVNDAAFLLINLCSANKECEQLKVLTNLCNFLSNITDLHCKNIIFGGDFNVFFGASYEAQAGNLTLKKSQ